MRKKVVVIGETCVDKFVYCEVNRLSPEAPVPVLNPIRTVKNDGMAGNTIANVKALLPECSIITFSPIKNPVKTRYVEEKTNECPSTYTVDSLLNFGEDVLDNSIV